MSIQRVPMTLQGQKQLIAELEQRKSVDRSKITAAIAQARAHGDLKENAEYHAAREQQSFNEGRIQAIETALSCAQVIDITSIAPRGKVIFGVTVELLNVETKASVTYQIVGDDEADIAQGKISISSPIARALIGKCCHDIVTVKAPNGDIDYEILAIRHK